jgi:hypothetical protein
MSCGQRHPDGDPAIGQPLCPDCFDYPSAVLFNASVPALWNQTARAIPQAIARELGISRRQLRGTLRVSFGKVIEYQYRSLIHLHAVIRLDGPAGPGDPAPPWAGTGLLRQAITTAATAASLTLPHPGQAGTLTLAWGSQTDIRAVRHQIGGELDDHKVAAYVAKYASKGTEDIGGIPRRIQAASDLDAWHVTPHARRLITACWQLGQRQEYASLRLAKRAHQLGYGGHFSTLSRRYSITLASRRDERRQARTAWARHQAGLPAQPGVITAEWHYARDRPAAPHHHRPRCSMINGGNFLFLCQGHAARAAHAAIVR